MLGATSAHSGTGGDLQVQDNLSPLRYRLERA